jgi:AraC family transcriptional regulator of adaptative response/methylated-DNA-[protein]-cysteine methyltransferase
MRENISNAKSITDAIYASGFGSNSRFYEGYKCILGMTPEEYRQGAQGKELRFALVSSSLGTMMVASTEIGICHIDLDDSPDLLLSRFSARFPNCHIIDGGEDFIAGVLSIVEMVDNPIDNKRSELLPLDIKGSVFQMKVWRELQEIPIGSTATYKDIAVSIGNAKASRAVALACAANPVAVAIPCHRVVRSNGNLSGYRWGVGRKQELLRREGCARKVDTADS